MRSRTLPLLETEGGFVHDYPLVLAGAMHYPECPQSIEHFRRIVGDDEEATPRKRSQINRVVHTDVAKRYRRGHIVGHIFCNLVEAVSSGEPISLNKSFYLAKRYAEVSDICEKNSSPTPRVELILPH